MGPKRNPSRASSSRNTNRPSSSRPSTSKEPEPPPDYDVTKFVSKAAFERYTKIRKRKVISERGFEYTESPCQLSTYEEIRGEIQRRGWAMFASEDVSHANLSVVLEFYANYLEMKNVDVFVRGVQVPVGIDTIA